MRRIVGRALLALALALFGWSLAPVLYGPAGW